MDRLGIVHGDVKPHNIIIFDDLQITLAELGLSRQDNTTTLSAAHLAPEFSSSRVTTASDMPVARHQV